MDPLPWLPPLIWRESSPKISPRKKTHESGAAPYLARSDVTLTTKVSGRGVGALFFEGTRRTPSKVFEREKERETGERSEGERDNTLLVPEPPRLSPPRTRRIPLCVRSKSEHPQGHGHDNDDDDHVRCASVGARTRQRSRGELFDVSHASGLRLMRLVEGVQKEEESKEREKEREAC